MNETQNGAKEINETRTTTTIQRYPSKTKS